MKKIVLMFMVVVLFVSMGTVPVLANSAYDEAVAIMKAERTDAYALDYYRNTGYLDSSNYVAQAKKIVKGIDDDYAKIKAIYDWVWWNVEGNCVVHSRTTQAIAQAAGFPVKYISGLSLREDGTSINHAWTEVFVNGKWIVVDPAMSRFDPSVSTWSQVYGNYSYDIKQQDEEAWNGSLYFYDSVTGKLLKEVKNFPFNGTIKSAYGFEVKNLYLDAALKNPVKLNTTKVTYSTSVIFVKPSEAATKKTYTITYKSNGATYKTVTAKENSYLKEPTKPTRKGYRFIGWYQNKDLTQTWNFTSSKVTKNQTLYAGWMPN